MLRIKKPMLDDARVVQQPCSVPTFSQLYLLPSLQSLINKSEKEANEKKHTEPTTTIALINPMRASLAQEETHSHSSI